VRQTTWTDSPQCARCLARQRIRPESGDDKRNYRYARIIQRTRRASTLKARAPLALYLHWPQLPDHSDGHTHPALLSLARRLSGVALASRDADPTRRPSL